MRTTNESEIRELLTFALLSLDPRIVDKRAALYSILIEVGLFVHGQYADRNELKHDIDLIVGQKDFLREEEFEYAINDCLKRGTVIKHDHGLELAAARQKSLKAAEESADEVEKRVTESLIDQIEMSIGELLPPDLKTDICDAVKRVLVEQIYKDSLDLARESLSIDEMLFRFEEFEPWHELDRTFEKHGLLENKLRRKQIKAAIIDYFRDLTSELKAMLRFVHHTVLINQILNIDPSMVQLQKEWFSHRRLYLDTNVVLAHIFEGQKIHPIASEVIQASINLQAQLLISPFTLQELIRQVERAKMNYLRLHRDPLVTRIAANADDAILATFVGLARQQPSLQWDGFIAPFEDIEETLMQYNILVETEGCDQINGVNAYDRIAKTITEVKPPHASENVIKHDTLNCLLILYLRKIYPPDERGHVVWLLTIDRSLKRVQRLLYGAKDIPGPYCIQLNEWGEVVLPAQSILGFVFDDFIGYLAQAKLGALTDPQVVQLNFLETILDANIDVERLSRLHIDQVRSTLVQLQTNKEARSLLKNSVYAEDINEKRTYQEQFSLILDNTLDETDPTEELRVEFENKAALLQQRINQRDDRISELDTRLKKAESNIGFRIFAWIQNWLSLIR